MLPPSLVSVYQQYKEDTNAVASWLASTAKSRGYPADLLSGTSSQATVPEHSKRLKGKARKQAKAAAQQAQASSSSPTNPDYIIAIKDFIPLAEFVAASKKPVISVPRSFAKTLNRVISTRSGFSTRLAESTDSPDVSADFTHSHFVGVLEKVREVLTPRFSSATRDAAGPPPPSDPIGEVGGRFASLSVDEPSEKFINAPDIERPVPVKDDDDKYVAEPIQGLEEILFAYGLLLIDLNKIRDRIKWIWANYLEGTFELVAAAIATNTACDLARNLMGDVTPMFTTHGGLMEIARTFYVCQCLEHGFSVNSIPDPGSTGDLNCETYDIINNTYILAFMVLETFLGGWDNDDVVLLKEPLPDASDAIWDRKRMSKQEKLLKDKVLLSQFLSELTIIVRHVEDFPVYDELLRGMEEFDQTRDIPMYLVFAAQVFLDIHHVMGKRVDSAYETCLSHLGLIDEDVALYEEFLAKVSTRASPSAYEYLFGVLRKTIKRVRDDPAHETKVKMFRDTGVLCNAPLHQALRYSPVISGLTLYHVRALTYVLGLKLNNFSGAITAPIHLYNALRQEKLLSPHQASAESWGDMDVALALLGNGSFYVGAEPPNNPINYMKKYALQMGASAATFSKRDRTCEQVSHFNKTLSKKGPRYIKKDYAPISNAFFDRYVRNTGQVDWTPELVNRVISSSPGQQKGSNESSEKLCERKKNAVSKTAGKKETSATSTHMLPEQLIKALTLALHLESQTLSFPYLTLQRAAWDMLREVRIASGPLMSESDACLQLDSEGQSLYIVAKIFTELVAGKDRLFLKAGDIIQEQLKRGEGNTAVRKLQAMGFTVQQLKGGDLASSI